jgi:pyruvate,water dikinase
LSHSNLVQDGETVLTARETYTLGKALDAIHNRFSSAYGPAAGNQGWYAMDVEFKFDGAAGEAPALYIKQARPYPGRGKE